MAILNPHKKPLAFVSEDGFVIPNPTFTSESLKHIKGRFVYTAKELNTAIDTMNEMQDDRRVLADEHYGADAINADFTEVDELTDVIEDLAGERETTPSFAATPTRPKKVGGASKKLTAPNLAPLPESLNVPQKGVGLSDEERDDLVGLDSKAAVAAMFGK